MEFQLLSLRYHCAPHVRRKAKGASDWANLPTYIQHSKHGFSVRLAPSTRSHAQL
jgi:hypothetical protein